ncbi:MAG: hypothetical protein ACRD0U_16060 [Acidimicrobiales bacterium]
MGRTGEERVVGGEIVGHVPDLGDRVGVVDPNDMRLAHVELGAVAGSGGGLVDQGDDVVVAGEDLEVEALGAARELEDLCEQNRDGVDAPVLAAERAFEEGGQVAAGERFAAETGELDVGMLGSGWMVGHDRNGPSPGTIPPSATWRIPCRRAARR